MDMTLRCEVMPGMTAAVRSVRSLTHRSASNAQTQKAPIAFAIGAFHCMVHLIRWIRQQPWNLLGQLAELSSRSFTRFSCDRSEGFALVFQQFEQSLVGVDIELDHVFR